MHEPYLRNGDYGREEELTSFFKLSTQPFKTKKLVLCGFLFLISKSSLIKKMSDFKLSNYFALPVQ